MVNQSDSISATRFRTSLQQLRKPLAARDHNANVMIRPGHKGIPLTARSGNDATANMPVDKQKSNRPVVPTLSASAARVGNKTPLTPRVAGSNPPLAATPLARRGASRPDTYANVTPTSSSQDISTPVSSFLANNITPRSGSRKSRVESPTNTPTGTPQPEATITTYDPGFGGVGGDAAGTRRPISAFGSSPPDFVGQKGHPQPSDESKFFYASDAKSTPPVTKAPIRPGLQSKVSNNFLYANGTSLPPPISSGSTLGSLSGGEAQSPKFFHANGTPDTQPVHSFFSPASSTISASSPRLAQSPVIAPSAAQRPTSPLKSAPVPVFSTTKTKSPVVPLPAPSRPLIGRGSTIQDARNRRVSIELPSRSSSHEVSLVMPELRPSARRLSSGPSLIAAMPPVNSAVMQQPVAASDEVGEETRSEASERPLSFLSANSDLQSPVKPGSTLEQMNELAAQARRERKVLDLEIRTTSLESINRTLERQLRKQTAELRRYRRLSRSGRLSIATVGSSRVSAGTLSVIGEDGLALSDMSEDGSDDESDEESEFSDSPSEGTLSPRAQADYDARHRKRDERRLQLDLSKHQQLLVDSQKMNQSLKRCLGWTEELINEGKKALAYSVRVSDVELGGRVLLPEELDGAGEEDGGDDEHQEPIYGVNQSREGDGNHKIWGGHGKEDRDSGIEIDAAQMANKTISETSS